jgi:polygalacturonase
MSSKQEYEYVSSFDGQKWTAGWKPSDNVSIENINSSLLENVKILKNITDLISSLTINKNLLLLNGAYTLSTDITSMSNSIVIEGQNNTIIDGNKKGMGISSLQNVTFKNIIFQNFYEIDLPSCANITFENCKFLNFIASGLDIANFKNVKFKGCVIDTIGSSSVNPTWQGSGIYANIGDGLTVIDCEIAHTFGQGGIFHIGVTNI